MTLIAARARFHRGDEFRATCAGSKSLGNVFANVRSMNAAHACSIRANQLIGMHRQIHRRSKPRDIESIASVDPGRNQYVACGVEKRLVRAGTSPRSKLFSPEKASHDLGRLAWIGRADRIDQRATVVNARRRSASSMARLGCAREAFAVACCFFQRASGCRPTTPTPEHGASIKTRSKRCAAEKQVVGRVADQRPRPATGLPRNAAASSRLLRGSRSIHSQRAVTRQAARRSAAPYFRGRCTRRELLAGLRIEHVDRHRRTLGLHPPRAGGGGFARRASRPPRRASSDSATDGRRVRDDAATLKGAPRRPRALALGIDGDRRLARERLPPAQTASRRSGRKRRAIDARATSAARIAYRDTRRRFKRLARRRSTGRSRRNERNTALTRLATPR